MREIKWEAPEFQYYEKDAGWYWLAGAVGIIIIAIALWQRNLLFSFFTGIAVILVMVWGKRQPRTISFHLTNQEIVIDKKRHRLENFSGFYVDDVHLILQNKGRLGSYSKIGLGKKRTEEIKYFLKDRLPEIDYRESLSDIIAHWIGF